MAIKQNTSNTIKVKVTNLGKDLHEEIVANFAIDNEVSGTKNISLAILHQQSQEITFTHLFNLPVSDHKLKVWFTDKLNNSSTLKWNSKCQMNIKIRSNNLKK